MCVEMSIKVHVTAEFNVQILQFWVDMGTLAAEEAMPQKSAPWRAPPTEDRGRSQKILKPRLPIRRSAVQRLATALRSS